MCSTACSANASSVTRSARADSRFASTRVASKTSGRVALPRRDNFMAPEGAARGPVRYLPCRNSDSTVSFLSSAVFRRHRSPRSNHEGGHVPEEDARRGVQARLARVWSRARILPVPNRSSRDPHDPNHRHQCDTCRLSSAAFRLHHKMWPPHRRLSYFPLKNASRHFLTASPSPTSSPAPNTPR